MQKPLFEYDPKLLLVNRELSARGRNLVALSDRLPNVEDEREKLLKSAQWCDKMHVILEDHLIKQRGQDGWTAKA